MYVENKYTAETHKTNRIVPTQPTDRLRRRRNETMNEQTVSPTYAETANTATGVGEDDPFVRGCSVVSRFNHRTIEGISGIITFDISNVAHEPKITTAFARIGRKHIVRKFIRV
jgi:hypothetical protein